MLEMNMPVENPERKLAKNPPDQRNNNASTAPRRLLAAQRREYVVALRAAGATLRQCADQAVRKFGEENLPKEYATGTRTVWRDIQRALEVAYANIQQDWTTYRMVQMDRYESVIRAHWAQAMKGHEGHTDRVLKAMAAQNKLLGLDAPQKHDVRVQRIDSRIEQLMAVIEGGPSVARLASGGEDEALGDAGAEGRELEKSIVEGTFRSL